MSDPIIVVKA